MFSVLCGHAQSCPTLCNPMDCSPPGSSVHGDSPSKNTEVGCHALLQGNFPNQGLNLGLWHCRQILYRLSHQGSPQWAYTEAYGLVEVDLSPILVLFGSNHFISCPWAVSFFLSLCPVPFSPVSMWVSNNLLIIKIWITALPLQSDCEKQK